jgi:hypothetical protein
MATEPETVYTFEEIFSPSDVNGFAAFDESWFPAGDTNP